MWGEAHMYMYMSSRCSDPSCQFIDKSLRNELSMQMAGSNVLDETDWTHCSDPSARLGLCSHTPGAQVVADIHGARLVHGGGAMVVDAVMSLVVSASAMQ